MVILVVDEEDRSEHTKRVNQLSAPASGRFVVHASALSSALPGQILLAMGRRHDEQLAAPTPGRERVLASAWLQAERKAHLFIYGAWRLSKQDQIWLSSLGRESSMTVWLITYPAAKNTSALAAIADDCWSFALFSTYWNARRRRPRNRRRGQERPATALDVSKPFGSDRRRDESWPYNLSRRLLDTETTRGAHTAYERLQWATSPGGNPRAALAETILRWFREWREPDQRLFVLGALRDAWFIHQESWLEWSPRTVHLDVPAPSAFDRTEALTTTDPAAALTAALATTASTSPVDLKEMIIAPDASHVLLRSGEIIHLPGQHRPIARAYQALLENNQLRRGRPAVQPQTVDELKPRESLRSGEDFSALTRIYSSIRLWPLNLEHAHSPFAFDGYQALPAPVEPIQVTYDHARILRGIGPQRPFPRIPGEREPDFPSLLRDLAVGGLIHRPTRNRGAQLPDWLGQLWERRRVVEPDPFSPPTPALANQGASHENGTT